MTIILENHTLPETGPVEIKVSLSFEIKVTAEEARRKVDHWLMDQVSYLMGAEPPTLVVGERVVWRVPAYLSFPSFGHVGTVGMIEVDVETGEMNNRPERRAEIEQGAEKIASQLPLTRKKREVPPEYLPKHVPPAPVIILPHGEGVGDTHPLASGRFEETGTR